MANGDFIRTIGEVDIGGYMGRQNGSKGTQGTQSCPKNTSQGQNKP
jgi:hypothetical protein